MDFLKEICKKKIRKKKRNTHAHQQIFYIHTTHYEIVTITDKYFMQQCCTTVGRSVTLAKIFYYGHI